VKVNEHRSPPTAGCTVRSLVAGWAACRFSLDELPALRQRPGLLQGAQLPTSFLKHADEQTVAGIAAVSKAIECHGLNQTDFSSWGIVAAPRFLGRAALAVALARFANEGAWGISPHLIPHRSLHALSGTVSQALKIHGPNYGVGGGADGAAEALLAGGALLADGQVPGLWIVLTGFDPELVPVNPAAEAPPCSTDCIAVALALVSAPRFDRGPFLSVGADNTADFDVAALPLFDLEDFAGILKGEATSARWRLRCGGWVAWEPAEAAVETCS
jgi:hypothetical protein